MKLIISSFKAFKLLLLFYAGATGVFACFAWFHILLGVVGGISFRSWMILALHGLLGVAVLLCGLMWFLLLNLLYSLLLKLLWAKPPAWVRINQGKRDTLIGFGIGTISCLPLAGLILGYFSSRYGGIRVLVEGLAVDGDQGQAAAILFGNFWWIWFLTATTLYFWLSSSKTVAERQPK